MPETIPPDSTVASVYDRLKNARQFTASLRQKMMTCEKQNGNASVKIGVTGRGYQPCYRITYEAGGAEHIYGSYWDNHQPLDREDAVNGNWSSASMSVDEVDAPLKEKINWKGTKKTSGK